MKINIFFILLPCLLVSCNDSSLGNEGDHTNAQGIIVQASSGNIKQVENSNGKVDLGSGFLLETDNPKVVLKYNGLIVKNWETTDKIIIEPFNARFYKIYKRSKNDFQIWLYDTISGNTQEFGDDKKGDIIESIEVMDDYIAINTRYSPQKELLNKNPHKFPAIRMYLNFSGDFTKLKSWQYLEYYRETSPEGDKKLIESYLKNENKITIEVPILGLVGSINKNSVYSGSLVRDCENGGTPCAGIPFIVVIDNSGKIAYYEEGYGSYQCKDIEKSLSGEILQYIGEKFCRDFPKDPKNSKDN